MAKQAIDNQAAEAAIRHRIHCFFSEMNAWELLCAKLIRKVEAETITVATMKDEVIGKLNEIFTANCSSDAKKTRVEKGSITFSAPPEYDPEKEVIETITSKGKRFFVTTRQCHHLKDSFVYTVTNQNENYLIHGRKLVLYNGNLEAFFL